MQQDDAEANEQRERIEANVDQLTAEVLLLRAQLSEMGPNAPGAAWAHPPVK